jgi:hypothetical protein
LLKKKQFPTNIYAKRPLSLIHEKLDIPVVAGLNLNGHSPKTKINHDRSGFGIKQQFGC